MCLQTSFRSPFPVLCSSGGCLKTLGVSSSFGPCWLSGPHISASRKAPFRRPRPNSESWAKGGPLGKIKRDRVCGCVCANVAHFSTEGVKLGWSAAAPAPSCPGRSLMHSSCFEGARNWHLAETLLAAGPQRVKNTLNHILLWAPPALCHFLALKRHTQTHPSRELSASLTPRRFGASKALLASFLTVGWLSFSHCFLASLYLPPTLCSSAQMWFSHGSFCDHFRLDQHS